MTGPRLEQYIDHLGEHRWRCVAANGRIVGDSAEGYVDETDMQRGALLTLEALLASAIPGVTTIATAWLANRLHDNASETDDQ